MVSMLQLHIPDHSDDASNYAGEFRSNARFSWLVMWPDNGSGFSALRIWQGSTAHYLLILIGALTAFPVDAAKVDELRVTHSKGQYTVYSEVLIAVPASRVKQLLMGYSGLASLHPNIRQVSVLEAGDSSSGTRMTIDSTYCFLLCVDMRWVQWARELPGGDIVTVFDPSPGSFKNGWVKYEFVAEGVHTRLVTKGALTPDFALPGLIGSLLLKNNLKHAAVEIGRAIERKGIVQTVAANLASH